MKEFMCLLYQRVLSRGGSRNSGWGGGGFFFFKGMGSGGRLKAPGGSRGQLLNFSDFRSSLRFLQGFTVFIRLEKKLGPIKKKDFR